MKTIVCLGDSITYNSDGPSYVNFWQERCDEKYGSGHYLIVGAGVCGETAFDGLQRVEHDVLRLKPDLVTVCFGHNEVHLGVPVAEYKQNIERIVVQVQARSAAVWLLTPTQIADVAVAQRYLPYLDSLKEISTTKQCRLLDLWHIFDQQNLDAIFTYLLDSKLGRDYLHPNLVGQRLIAHRLMQELRSTVV